MKKILVNMGCLMIICTISLFIACGIHTDKSILYNKNIVVFGDSITWGQASYNSISNNPWPSVLENKTGAHITNLGMPGSTMALVDTDTYAFLDELNRDAFVSRIEKFDLSEYDYIFIAYGTNDLSFEIPIGENDSTDKYTFKGALNCSVEQIFEKNKDIQIVLVTPMLDSRLDMRFADAVKEFGEAKGIPVIDLSNLKITQDDLYHVYWDHATMMHPTESTYYAMGTYMSAYPEFEKIKCYKITYDSRGGVIDMAKSIAIQGEKIGPMFITCKQGYTFAGWYTELEGGELVTEDSIYDFDRDITLYAHYLEN